jgi:hypothetical protein
MRPSLLDLRFAFIGAIEPKADATGKILEVLPQSRYLNSRNLPLHGHGSGPFCEFRLVGLSHEAGVYALVQDAMTVYIGECVDLAERFGPRGYGTIHPRNCFQRGQPTNCKINNRILEAAKRNLVTEVWFLPTPDRKRVESELLRRYRPPWNGRSV